MWVICDKMALWQRYNLSFFYIKSDFFYRSADMNLSYGPHISR